MGSSFLPRVCARRLRVLVPLLIGGLLSLPAQSATLLSSVLAPSQNFELRQWKLTLPSAAEVSPAELNSGFQYAEVFFTDPRTGGMVFRCPNLAVSTTNSQYPRSELREMLDPDNTSAKATTNNWTPEQGGWLRAKLRIDQVSTTGDDAKLGRVIIGQIHGPDTEPLRLYYVKKPGEKTGRLYAAIETMSGSTYRSPDIVSNKDNAGIALGENFTYQIKLYGTNLTVAIYRGDGRKHVFTRDIDSAYLGHNLYFKAGVYNQNNTGDVSDYVQATFFILEHVH